MSNLEELNKHLKIEVNSEKLKFVDTILNNNLVLFLFKNIYEYLHDNFGKIIASTILTSSEEAVLVDFEKEYSSIINEINKQIKKE